MRDEHMAVFLFISRPHGPAHEATPFLERLTLHARHRLKKFKLLKTREEK